MTSYELLDFYEQILGKMEELDAYTKTLSDLINVINGHGDVLLSLVYSTDMSQDTINKSSQQRGKVINDMQAFAMSFDILANHQKLIRVKEEISIILSNSYTELSEEKNKINNLLDEFFKVTSIIYEFVKTRSNQIIVNLLNEVSITVNKYDKFVESYKILKEFMSKTENHLEEREDEKIFKIHFYDEHLDPEYFVLNIHSINESYEIMCQILNVSFSEYPLKVLKIESGSLLGKFLGYVPVVESLTYLSKKIIDLIFNKFTFEGKVLRTKQIFDLLNEDLVIRAKYKELGFETNLGEEEFTKYHYQLVKSIGKLVGQTTKVKINDEEFCLESHLKQKYLTESSALLIEESNIKNDLPLTTQK